MDFLIQPRAIPEDSNLVRAMGRYLDITKNEKFAKFLIAKTIPVKLPKSLESMWRDIAKYFNKYPKQRKLALILFRYGLRIYNNKIFCGEIELTDSKIARAFEIDRRIISSTIETIMKNEDLRMIFSNLLPTCHLKDVASKMNWGVIEIIPKDASAPGIIADVASIIADNNISIRQAIVDDFEFSEEPRLFIVTERQIPGLLLPKIRKTKGVKAVVVY